MLKKKHTKTNGLKDKLKWTPCFQVKTILWLLRVIWQFSVQGAKVRASNFMAATEAMVSSVIGLCLASSWRCSQILSDSRSQFLKANKYKDLLTTENRCLTNSAYQTKCHVVHDGFGWFGAKFGKAIHSYCLAIFSLEADQTQYKLHDIWAGNLHLLSKNILL